jgi:3'-phosphoadenosine 5'-phosphosulfate sulfotransferase (PAPS reductase)/FAD synthetase
VRWCSPSLKMDVCNIAINNDPRFRGKKILIVTGERRQESTARSKYAEVIEHNTTSKKWNRRTDQWRAIINWSEQDVWDCLKRHKINPHPAYRLGWGRVSCMACIFGDKDQWASVKEIAPHRFFRIMQYEEQFGCTIDQNYSVWDMAQRGKSFVKDADPKLLKLAMSKKYTDSVFVENWELPKGAYKRCGGPT